MKRRNSGAAPRPHIVYIVADDLGWKDVGFHGSDIKTPNIDKLAQEGARLEQFYVQPMCTPTRAALMTGRYPFRYGLQTLVIPTAWQVWPADRRMAAASGSETGGLQDGDGRQVAPWPRRPQVLAEAARIRLPLWRHAGRDRLFHACVDDVRDWYRDNQPVKEEGYVTQLLGKDAVARINEHDAKTPLFLYLAFTAPHAPYQAPKQYLDQYKHIADPTRRAYAAMVTSMDDEIGKVVAALDKKKMRENTLIVFMSDNGGNVSAMFSGDVDVSKLKLPADNGPYRGGKGMLYEGGTRVAALANWPGQIKAGEVKEMHPCSGHVPDASRAGRCRRQKGKTARRDRRLVRPSARASLRRVRRWFTTSSRSAAGCAEATGNLFGGLRSVLVGALQHCGRPVGEDQPCR